MNGWNQETKYTWTHRSGARVVCEPGGWSVPSRRLCQRPWAAKDPQGNLLRDRAGRIRTFELASGAQKAVEIAIRS